MNLTFKILGIGSMFVLSSALVIDYVLGFMPCHLCIYQRIPYVIFCVLSLAWFKYSKQEKILRAIFLCCVINAIFSVLLSGYHTGVERHVFGAMEGCKSELSFDKINSVEDLEAQLELIPTADCRKPAFKILFLSLAEINLIISLMVLVFILYKGKIYL
jgi:disulfide bond formation protein DsbB